MKVSAVWIAKNEEDNLPRSLASLAAVADELVVVDTGSTDGTAAAAAAAGARVVPYQWQNDFAAARNFALAQATGDVIFFLDADEWFEPALTKADRAALERNFHRSGLIAMSVQRTDVDPDMQITIAVGESQRIFRAGALEYQGVIHERVVPLNKQYSGIATMPGWNLNHSGYRRGITLDKQMRNMHMLEAAVQNLPTGMDKALYHMYIIREAEQLQPALAFASLQWLLAHPAPFKMAMQGYVNIGKSTLFDALRLAAAFRGKISRRQLLAVVVENGEKIYPKEPLSAVLRLYYQCQLDPQQTRLLAALPGAMARAQALQATADADQHEYKRALTDIYTAAAQAAYRLGRTDAFDYATKALTQNIGKLWPEAFLVVLRCLRGVPAAEVITYLQQVLGAGNRGVLEMMLRNITFEGYREVYTYLMKKEIDGGWARKYDFWYLLVVLGRHQDAIDAALADEGTDEMLVQQAVYLAVLCSGRVELLLQYKDQLGEYTKILELFFYGKNSESMNFGIVVSTYREVAFAAGREVANRLLRAFPGLEWEGFLVQAKYYMEAGLHAQLLAESSYRPNADNAAGQLLLAECQALAGQPEEALAACRTVLAHSPLDENWFTVLGMIEAAAPEGVGQQAAQLAAQYRPAYDQTVDLADVVHTGVVFEADDKKQRKQLATLTLAQLTAAAPAPPPPFAGQADTLHAAAGVYLEHKAYSAALGCWQQVLALGGPAAAAYAGMAQLFAAVGNNETSRGLWQLAKEAEAGEAAPQ